MNLKETPGAVFKFFYRQALRARWLLGKQTCRTFNRIDKGTSSQNIEQIYVINLDRQPERWQQTKQELSRILDASGEPLSELTTRISAIDASQFDHSMNIEEVTRNYCLRDQLFVEPRQKLPRKLDLDKKIEMTEPEIAVALSHVKTWRQVANGNDSYVLVLEDDVRFRYNFARYVDRIWQQLCSRQESSPLFDILYLSFKEVEHGAEKYPITEEVLKLFRGLWYLSGYVLSKRGAEKLLNLLPICGPVDLWINHQFDDLTALMGSKSMIVQRMDQKSGNSYSVLPVLSKIGVLNSETPGLFEAPSLPKPVFAIGTQNSGLTSLAMALSMLGYQCCSDLDELPSKEGNKLMQRDESRMFDAYVNIGSIEDHLNKLAILYPESKLIIATETDNNKKVPAHFQRWSDRVLILPLNSSKKWKLLCEFLGTVPPASPYPSLAEKGQRKICQNSKDSFQNTNRSEQWLKADTLPWVASQRNGWKGIPSKIDKNNSLVIKKDSSIITDHFNQLDETRWLLRDDTFPGNLALFRPSNFSLSDDGTAEIKVRREEMKVRNYSSGALTTHTKFLHGRFEAVLKPPKVPGLVTGLFLHRNSPRQEIDIEFLGKYPHKVLLNVFYNPGDKGARFDYGYRGTPVLVDVGFDVTSDFHTYAIEWEPTELRWFVDDQLIHKRVNWEPTPIPHLPMKYHVNLWPSKSRELAGKIANRLLPATVLLQSVKLPPLLNSHTV